MSDTPQGTHPTPFLLGIVGDSGSGKTTAASGVARLLGPERVSTLELDDYLLLTRAERRERGVSALDPSVHDLPRVEAHLRLLRDRRAVENRAYDHADGTFGAPRRTEPREIVLVRGLFGFATEELRAAYDLAVFLDPEPELLFRWERRRDVGERGYSEAEALKRIAQRLLDSKEFLTPQAERADLVVRSVLPHPDAPDSEVRTVYLLRGVGADALRGHLAMERFAAHLRLEERDGELLLELADTLTLAEVERWARDCFPAAENPELLGVHRDASGELARRTALAFSQVLIATLVRQLRGRAAAAE